MVVKKVKTFVINYSLMLFEIVQKSSLCANSVSFEKYEIRELLYETGESLKE